MLLEFSHTVKGSLKMDHEIYKSATKNALKQLRLDAQITQKQLASLINKPQSFISKYENGDRDIDFVTVYLVCSALRRDLNNFQELFESYIPGR